MWNKARKGTIRMNQRMLCILDETSTESPRVPAPPVVRDSMCDDDMESMRFNFLNVVANNLGGQGPLAGDEFILYKSVAGSADGTYTIDMKVETEPGYKAPMNN